MFKKDTSSVGQGSGGKHGFPSRTTPPPASLQDRPLLGAHYIKPAETYSGMEYTNTPKLLKEDGQSSLLPIQFTNSSGQTFYSASAANFTSASPSFQGNLMMPQQDIYTATLSGGVGPSLGLVLSPTSSGLGQSAASYRADSKSPSISAHSQSGDRYSPAGQSRSPYSAYSPSEAKPSGSSTKASKRVQMSEGFTDQSVFDGSAVGLELASSLHKLEQQQSPTDPRSQFSYSRTSSTGSVHAFSCSSASSAQNTDDEDSDGTTKAAQCYKDRRREAHTAAEQKRRDAIKKGYDELQMIVPTCANMETLGSTKLSKATVLQKSIDYIEYLTEQKKKQEGDLEKLRKDVMGLKIMKANYEHIVKAHQSTPQAGLNQVPDEVKFQVFQGIMDKLFQSFNASISVANFAELSGCVFTWLEEHCKPQSLQETTLHILRQLNTQL